MMFEMELKLLQKKSGWTFFTDRAERGLVRHIKGDNVISFLKFSNGMNAGI